MYEILRREKLTPNVNLFEVNAPAIANKAEPGQFIILRVCEEGERFPITIADTDPDDGTVTIIFAEVGKSSKLLGRMDVSEKILNFAGPLGNPTKIENYGDVLCIGGGVFLGALLYQIRALKELGNQIYSIIGARNIDHLFWIDKFEEVSEETWIATDDGSKGYEGIEFLYDLLKKYEFDQVITMGPTSMQKMVSEATKPYNIPTTVNLFPIMVDGTGMCGSCRVTVGGETLFACVDGPDFDGHKVDFDELISRMRYYNQNEKIAMVLLQED
ncbi:MAG: sulfide/dihydroorotate dehydrogenase-like FAD/NAD-binding protein [Candidatus Bathyarchaeia archaeon]